MNKFKELKTIENKLNQLIITVYEEEITGLQHIHINPMKSFNDEKGFLLKLNTVPDDNTGTQHILEHMVLQSNNKYPIKNLFFKLRSKSSAIFLNALTKDNTTSYVFNTYDDFDFNQNLDIYLESVFNATLNKEEFKKEGWHYSLNENNEFEYNGIVFNEMKGFYDDNDYHLMDDINKNIFDNHNFSKTSIGLPSEIVDLDYQTLIDYYHKHYVPSNATIYTYGNIDINKTQNRIYETIKNFNKNDLLNQDIKLKHKEAETLFDKNFNGKSKTINYSSNTEDYNKFILLISSPPKDNQVDFLIFDLIFKVYLSQNSFTNDFEENNNVINMLSEYNNLSTKKDYVLISYQQDVEKFNNNSSAIFKENLLNNIKNIFSNKIDPILINNYINNLTIDTFTKTNNVNYSFDTISNISKIDLDNLSNLDQNWKEALNKIYDENYMKQFFSKYIENNTINFTAHPDSNLDNNMLNVLDKKLKERVSLMTPKVKKEALNNKNELINYLVDDKKNDHLIQSKKIENINLFKNNNIQKATYIDNIIFYDIDNQDNDNNHNYVNLSIISSSLPQTIKNEEDYLILLLLNYFKNNLVNINDLSIDETNNIIDNNVISFMNFENEFKNLKLNIMEGVNITDNNNQLFETLLNNHTKTKIINKENLFNKIIILKQYINNYGEFYHNNEYKSINGLDANPEHKKLNIDFFNKTTDFIDKIITAGTNSIIFNELLIKLNETYSISHNKNNYCLKLIGSKKDLSCLIETQRKLNLSSHPIDGTKPLKDHFINHILNKDVINENQLNLIASTNKNPFTDIEAKKIALLNNNNVSFNKISFRFDNTPKNNVIAKILGNILKNDFLYPKIRFEGGAYQININISNNHFICNSVDDPENIKTFNNIKTCINDLINSNITQEQINNSIVLLFSNKNNIKSITSLYNESFKLDIFGDNNNFEKQFNCSKTITENDIKDFAKKFLLQPSINLTISNSNQNNKDLLKSNGFEIYDYTEFRQNLNNNKKKSNSI